MSAASDAPSRNARNKDEWGASIAAKFAAANSPARASHLRDLTKEQRGSLARQTTQAWSALSPVAWAQRRSRDTFAAVSPAQWLARCRMPLQAELLGLSVAPAERRCSHAVKWAAHLTVEHPTPWAAGHLIWLHHPVVVAAPRWVLVAAAVTAVRIELNKA